PFMKNDLNPILSRGLSYGVPSALEVEMAERLVGAYQGMDMVRMVNSGTEATMSAIRVARGFTSRNKILKFEGCYHGHSDALLVKSGSGTLTYGVPTSLGVPESVVKDTIVLRYNDSTALIKAFEEYGKDLAAVIIEPVAGNMGVVPSELSFLSTLRELCDEYGTILIFDEVITGFRLAYGGASEVYGIIPDMVCFGKIIGGGLPVGAYGGKLEIMSTVSPLGGVYQAGTLSGNPLAMYFGIQMLDYLKDNPNVYQNLEDMAKYLESEMVPFIEKHQLPVSFKRYKSMPCLFFVEGEINNYDDVKLCDTNAYATYFRAMLERGILLPPAQFEGLFLSTAHTEAQLHAYLDASKTVLMDMYR
ncbi:MAG: glutamate-1-semialdehyde 2,1-aminomutase, partial [Bacillota bacterium]|nr:glutamate-1-semialdehyde 2,1-aminomutase [Bacillota bacterium]